MGKAKRCRSVVVSASVAAMSAAGACPAANAASGPPGASRPPAGAVARKQPAHAHRHVAQPHAAPHGPYVYKVLIGGAIRWQRPNITCVGSSIRFSNIRLQMPESAAANELADHNETAFWGHRVTITTAPTTTITMPWNSEQETREAEHNNGAVPHPRNLQASTAAERVCTATTPNAPIGSIGEGTVTWRLPAPASNLAALLHSAPASVYLNELTAPFSIQPDGSVPTFQPA